MPGYSTVAWSQCDQCGHTGCLSLTSPPHTCSVSTSRAAAGGPLWAVSQCGERSSFILALPPAPAFEQPKTGLLEAVGSEVIMSTPTTSRCHALRMAPQALLLVSGGPRRAGGVALPESPTSNPAAPGAGPAQGLGLQGQRITCEYCPLIWTGRHNLVYRHPKRPVLLLHA